MSWTHYRLIFRLESPLHIGYRKTGNLMQSRRYVPGKNLWAALTERIGLLHGAGDNHRVYRAIGLCLKKYFRFGYLWPTYEGRTSDWAPHFPWDDPAHWDYLYLDSQARTALDPFARTAAEGMLYDVEFIAPYTREGRPVYLVGDLWVRTNAPQAINMNGSSIPLDWRTALQHLQIGGERTYGWGRLRLMEPANWEENGRGPGDLPHWGNGWHWDEKDGEVVIESQENAGEGGENHIRLPVHALAADANGSKAVVNLQGPVEPVLGWERQSAAGYRLSQAMIMYEPGTRVVSALRQAYLAPWGYLQGPQGNDA